MGTLWSTTQLDVTSSRDWSLHLAMREIHLSPAMLFGDSIKITFICVHILDVSIVLCLLKALQMFPSFSCPAPYSLPQPSNLAPSQFDSPVPAPRIHPYLFHFPFLGRSNIPLLSFLLYTQPLRLYRL